MQAVVSGGKHRRQESGKTFPYPIEGVFSMLRKRRTRRVLAIFLVVLGGVLMYLAPEMWAGLVVLAVGVVVELAGIALERRA
jgi:hypothetical protein